MKTTGIKEVNRIVFNKDGKYLINILRYLVSRAREKDADVDVTVCRLCWDNRIEIKALDRRMEVKNSSVVRKFKLTYYIVVSRIRNYWRKFTAFIKIEGGGKTYVVEVQGLIKDRDTEEMMRKLVHELLDINMVI